MSTPTNTTNSDKQRPSIPVDRDEGTLGLTRPRESSPPGVADEDQPIQRPPETQPEPRPVTPVMDPSPNSSQSTNTNSPA